MKQITFRSDIGLRKRLFAPEVFIHPAKLHLRFLQYLIDVYTVPGDTLLDPMAGSGSLLIAATLQRHVILRELQPEYIRLIESSIPSISAAAGLFAGEINVAQADARVLECPAFSHIITSPPYGFETGSGITDERRKRLMICHADKLSGFSQSTYTGGFRYAGDSNIGNLSGRNYWREMGKVYSQLAELLPPGGRMILILKNHYRRGRIIDVVGQTKTEVQQLNLVLLDHLHRWIDAPSHWQREREKKGLPIIRHEDALVFQKPGC